MALAKSVIDDLKVSTEVLKEAIEGSRVVLQKKNIPVTGENVLKAAQIIATNRLAMTNEVSKKVGKSTSK